MAKKIKKCFLIFVLAALLGGFFPIASGQIDLSNQTAITPEKSNTENRKPEFFVDWSAQTYAPLEYEGKILPTFDSTVNLSATPLNESAMKGDFRFNWIIDNSTALPSKEQVASFKINKSAGDKHKVYLRIFNKNNTIITDYYFEIPISKHQIILYTENINGSLNAIDGPIFIDRDSTMKFTAKSLFFNNIFNKAGLRYLWKLNNQEMNTDAIDPDKLEISFPEIPKGTQYNLKLAIRNPFDVHQVAEKDYIIKVK